MFKKTELSIICKDLNSSSLFETEKLLQERLNTALNALHEALNSLSLSDWEELLVSSVNRVLKNSEVLQMRIFYSSDFSTEFRLIEMQQQDSEILCKHSFINSISQSSIRQRVNNETRFWQSKNQSEN